MTVTEIVEAQMLRLRRLGLMHEGEVRDALMTVAEHAKQATEPFSFADDGRGPFIHTYPSGTLFYPYHPLPDDICIEDIAHGLSTECRFGGHCPFYSVAQHCVHVTRALHDDGADVCFAALLHDAAEAYLSDVPRPLKYTPAFAVYRELERLVQAAIYTKFEITVTDEMKARIHYADDLMLATEKKELFTDFPHGHARQPDEVLPEPIRMRITPVIPAIAENQFLREFAYLKAQRAV